MQFCSGRRHSLFSLIYSSKKTNMNFQSIYGNATTPFLLLLAPINSFYSGGIRLWKTAVVLILRVIALAQIFYTIIKGVAVSMVYSVSRRSVVISPYKSMRSVQNIVYANLVVVMRICTCKHPSHTSSFSLFPIQVSVCIVKQCLQIFFSKVTISSVHGESNHVKALYNTGTRQFT